MLSLMFCLAPHPWLHTVVDNCDARDRLSEKLVSLPFMDMIRQDISYEYLADGVMHSVHDVVGALVQTRTGTVGLVDVGFRPCSD